MAKYLKKKGKNSGAKALWLVVGCLALVAAFWVARGMFPANEAENPGADSGSQEQVQSTDKETQETKETNASDETESAGCVLTVDTVEEAGDMMVVTTSYCTVKFPFAFSDIIRVEAVEHNGKNALLFQAYLENEVYPMFCFVFDGAEGVRVGTLALENGTEAAVMLEIFEASTAIDPSLLNTFYAAQETLNDVIVSLTEAEGFVPAA